MQNSKFKIQNLLLLFCTLHFALCIGCSIPTLETSDCTQAREALREFYSFHYSNDTKFTKENLQQRERFLTPELFQNLMQKADGGKDYFTDADETPKAFRIGGCKVSEPNQKVNFGVVLMWRDESKTEQKEVQVQAVKQNDKWLINKVGN